MHRGGDGDRSGGRIPVLDLDLSKLTVGSRNGSTVLSGIGLSLDPAAALDLKRILSRAALSS